MRLWIRNPLAVLCDGAAGGVVVEDGVICELVAAGKQPAAPVDQTFDASEHVILPGLINTHHHFYQTLTRAHPDAINKELFPWLQALYPVWARLTPEAHRLASRLALVELMMSGGTCASDHHYLFPDGLENAMDIQVEEALALGMRLTVTRGSMNLSEKDGGLPPDSVVQDADEILADCERVIGKYHDGSAGAKIQVALAPCSPFSVTRELMKGCADIAGKCSCRLHTHLAETHDEDAYCQELFGLRPLDYLEDVGWLHENTWLAHGIHFKDDEVERLGRAGVAVC
ncbi:MAG TPA: 8-oxoguanine deaminase, partial [Rhizobiales bacterium]|nr:8-oxoguanine deaminase [Hyphomicrobiales bacterium]